MAEKAEEDLNQYRTQRLEKLAKLRELGVDPYPYGFPVSATASELNAKYQDLAPGTETQDQVSVAGRIRAIRNSGMFIDLHDATGKIQVFNHKDKLSAQGQEILPLLDLGDIVGVSGQIRRTPRGELTVNSATVTVLAKAQLPPPEKYHGLADVETRYRQRYVDLIANEDSRETLRRRSRIIATMRRLLRSAAFSKSRRRCCTPSPAAPRPSRSSPTTTRST